MPVKAVGNKVFRFLAKVNLSEAPKASVSTREARSVLFLEMLLNERLSNLKRQIKIDVKKQSGFTFYKQ